jgi:hypothetical protein
MHSFLTLLKLIHFISKSAGSQQEHVTMPWAMRLRMDTLQKELAHNQKFYNQRAPFLNLPKTHVSRSIHFQYHVALHVLKLVLHQVPPDIYKDQLILSGFFLLKSTLLHLEAVIRCFLRSCHRTAVICPRVRNSIISHCSLVKCTVFISVSPSAEYNLETVNSDRSSPIISRLICEAHLLPVELLLSSFDNVTGRKV